MKIAPKINAAKDSSRGIRSTTWTLGAMDKTVPASIDGRRPRSGIYFRRMKRTGAGESDQLRPELSAFTADSHLLATPLVAAESLRMERWRI